jgi:hypothetical protein
MVERTNSDAFTHEQSESTLGSEARQGRPA